MAFKNDIEKGIVVEVKAVSNDSVVSLNDATITAPAPAPADEQPLVRQDGGLTAWAQVAAGFLLSCVAWGYPAMFGVYQSYYTKTLLLPAVQVSWIGSIQTFLTYLISTASGRLSDAGYAKIVILVGSTIVVLGTIMTSLATEYWQILLAQGIFTGCGLGLLTAPTVAIIPHYFDKKRAFALSLASAGTSAGGAFFPAVVQYLLPHIGFAWAVRCSALLAAVLCVNAYFLLRPRPVVKTAEKKALVDLAAFKEIPYSLFVLSSFLLFWVLYFGFFYINVYAEQTLNFSASSAASLLIIATATGIPGRLLIGIVADRWTGAMNTFILSVAALGLVHFAWAGVTSAGGMYAFVTAFGLANGAAQGVWIGALTTVASDPAKMGERFGMVCTVTAFATLAGPPTAGAVVDKAGWLGGQMWAGVVILLASLAVVIGRSNMVGWKFAVKV